MSEEEKKAIEWFKKDLMFWLIEGKDYVIIDNGEIPKMKSILNLIEKQQKEIEEKNIAINKMSKDISHQLKEIEQLKFNNHMVDKWNEYLDKDCISKDKIREKIKAFQEIKKEILKNENELSRPSITYDIIRNDYCEKMLNKLLEEN